MVDEPLTEVTEDTGPGTVESWVREWGFWNSIPEEARQGIHTLDQEIGGIFWTFFLQPLMQIVFPNSLQAGEILREQISSNGQLEITNGFFGAVGLSSDVSVTVAAGDTLLDPLQNYLLENQEAGFILETDIRGAIQAAIDNTLLSTVSNAASLRNTFDTVEEQRAARAIEVAQAIHQNVYNTVVTRLNLLQTERFPALQANSIEAYAEELAAAHSGLPARTERDEAGLPIFNQESLSSTYTPARLSEGYGYASYVYRTLEATHYGESMFSMDYWSQRFGLSSEDLSGVSSNQLTFETIDPNSNLAIAFTALNNNLESFAQQQALAQTQVETLLEITNVPNNPQARALATTLLTETLAIDSSEAEQYGANMDQRFWEQLSQLSQDGRVINGVDFVPPAEGGLPQAVVSFRGASGQERIILAPNG